MRLDFKSEQAARDWLVAHNTDVMNDRRAGATNQMRMVEGYPKRKGGKNYKLPWLAKFEDIS